MLPKSIVLLGMIIWGEGVSFVPSGMVEVAWGDDTLSSPPPSANCDGRHSTVRPCAPQADTPPTKRRIRVGGELFYWCCGRIDDLGAKDSTTTIIASFSPGPMYGCCSFSWSAAPQSKFRLRQHLRGGETKVLPKPELRSTQRPASKSTTSGWDEHAFWDELEIIAHPPRLLWPRSAHPTTNIFVSCGQQKIQKWRELVGRTP